jgi:putative transposase
MSNSLPKGTNCWGTYLFTVVTFMRRPILCNTDSIEKIKTAFTQVMKKHPFNVDAMVLLPDHLHCLWTLPDNDQDFSTRWRLIKSQFTRACDGKSKLIPSRSRSSKKEQAVWQRRFWEHLIRNEDDYVRHLEYIHYNPVKHGFVDAPAEWPHSTFHRYVRNGLYSNDWGAGKKIRFGKAIGNE